MVILLLLIFFSYLIGSISGGILIGKLKNIDIRKSGSGNAGGTNAFRTQGLIFALPVVIIDVSKGYIPTQFFHSFSFIKSESLVPFEMFPLICGFAAVIGHCYPIFYNFKGGKGAGTILGMLLSVFPQALIPAICVWIITLILTGYVGLGTMLAGITIAVTANFFPLESMNLYMDELSLILMIFIIFTHRSNIQRMLNKNENQFEKIMLFKKK